MPEKPLTVEQTAERWGVSASHVRNLIKAGHLKAAALGAHTIRITQKEIIKLEENGIPYYNDRITRRSRRSRRSA